MILARSASSLRRGNTVCVSGSPNRTLYSKTFGPLDVNIRPVNSSPTNGYPTISVSIDFNYHPSACHLWSAVILFFGSPLKVEVLQPVQEHNIPFHLYSDLYLRQRFSCGLGRLVRVRLCIHR